MVTVEFSTTFIVTAILVLALVSWFVTFVMISKNKELEKNVEMLETNLAYLLSDSGMCEVTRYTLKNGFWEE